MAKNKEPELGLEGTLAPDPAGPEAEAPEGAANVLALAAADPEHAEGEDAAGAPAPKLYRWRVLHDTFNLQSEHVAATREGAEAAFKRHHGILASDKPFETKRMGKAPAGAVEG